ncbi:phosphoribosyltransferase [Candidatus Bathyarchaeota archaeon]|nr:MAG: phosphoribosyltransferase [Candidatus Bathyarchaeota archaeon]
MPKKMPVKVVSWNEVVEWSRSLAQKIRSSGFKPDVIIAIARGGFVPARLLCDYLDVVDLLSIKIEHWIETGKHKEEATIKYPFDYDLSGRKVLIVDDIADTGKSVVLASKHVAEKCKPEELKTATMQVIPATSMIIPDYYVDEVKEWTWYMYPWNFTEDMINLTMRLINDKPDEKWRVRDIAEGFRENYGVNFPIGVFNEILEEMISRGKINKVNDYYVKAQKTR